jgi:hypothetical protein
MASPSTLKSDLETIFEAMNESEMSDSDYADKLSKAIDAYIKTFMVKSGIGVQVNIGTGTGSTTATGVLE